MNTAAWEFQSYLPQRPAQEDRRRGYRAGRTAETRGGWTVSEVLRTVSTVVPVIGAGSGLLAGAFAHATHAPVTDALSLVAPAQHADALNALRRELLAYQRLPHDWDGYGGHPASPLAMLDALAFLAAMPTDLPIPAPMFSGSGAVGLYWDRGSHYASLEFEGDGTYTYLLDSPEGYRGDEGIPAGALPDKLRGYLVDLPKAG